jgi:hypothetical protein
MHEIVGWIVKSSSPECLYDDQFKIERGDIQPMHIPPYLDSFDVERPARTPDRVDVSINIGLSPGVSFMLEDRMLLHKASSTVLLGAGFTASLEMILEFIEREATTLVPTHH